MADKGIVSNNFRSQLFYSGLLLSVALSFLVSPWFSLPALIFAYLTWAPTLERIRAQRAVRHSQAAAQENKDTFESLFGLLARLAAGDKGPNRSQLKVLNKFLRSELRADRSQLRLAKKVIRNAARSKHPFEKYLEDFCASVENNTYVLQATFELMLRLAAADGKLRQEEEKMLQVARQRFGIPEEVYTVFKAGYFAGRRGSHQRGSQADRGGANNHSESYHRKNQNRQKPHDEWLGGDHYHADEANGEQFPNREESISAKTYALLELQPDASEEEIRSSYRRLAKANHPDSLRSQKLPERVIEAATEKFKQVTAAYEQIMNERQERAQAEST